MNSPAVEHLDQRNAMAEKVIERFARHHAAVDVTSGVVLGLLPFGNLAALVAQLVYSGTVIYPAMAECLAAVYQVNLDETESQLVRWRLPLTAEGRELIHRGFDEAALDTLVQCHTEIFREISRELAAHPQAAQVVANIANDFGTEFLQDIANELLSENASAAFASAIPILGSVIGAGFDEVLGVMMTWRVGATASAYFQNGGYIGSRKRTYELVKPQISWSPEWQRPGTLTRMRHRVQPLRDKQLEYVRQLMQQLPGSRSTKRSELVDRRGIPADLVDSA